MSSALVLGLGNSLSGADAFGPAVVESLRGAADLPSSVRLIDAHTDLLAYIDQFAQYDRVILVDAVISPSEGGVATCDERAFSGWDDSSPGAHELSPLMAVKLFRRLGPSQGPEITLVAHLILEDDFRRPPTNSEIAAGVAAVRALIAGRVSSNTEQ